MKKNLKLNLSIFSIVFLGLWSVGLTAFGAETLIPSGYTGHVGDVLNNFQIQCQGRTGTGENGGFFPSGTTHSTVGGWLTFNGTLTTVESGDLTVFCTPGFVSTPFHWRITGALPPAPAGLSAVFNAFIISIDQILKYQMPIIAVLFATLIGLGIMVFYLRRYVGRK